jgi:serine/threonine protein kinase
LVAAVTNPDKFLIVTELADNGSLVNLLLKDDPIDWDTMLSFSLDIARGMNYLHKNNVVHRFGFPLPLILANYLFRDLKTDNILLSKANTCKIADFGISTFYSENSRKMKYGT